MFGKMVAGPVARHPILNYAKARIPHALVLASGIASVIGPLSPSSAAPCAVESDNLTLPIACLSLFSNRKVIVSNVPASISIGFSK